MENKLLMKVIITSIAIICVAIFAYAERMNKSDNLTKTVSTSFLIENLDSVSNLDSLYFRHKTSKRIDKGIEKWQLTKVSTLNPIKEEGETNRGFVIVSSCDSLSENATRNLRTLLQSAKSYYQGNIVKNSTFLPDYACQFCNNGDTIDVLVALYCDEIRIYHKKKVYTLDITPSHKQFTEFIKQIFPNDNYLKKY